MKRYASHRLCQLIFTKKNPIPVNIIKGAMKMILGLVALSISGENFFKEQKTNSLTYTQLSCQKNK